MSNLIQIALQQYRQTNQCIVLTNGCFDILHVGHVRYLQTAKKQGDILIVALNSDRSVRSLKGSTRPFNSENDRAEVISALACVTHTVIFDELTADRLIVAIHPNIYVKGGDYTLDTLPEKQTVLELGIEAVFIPFEGNYSTTDLVSRIQQVALMKDTPSF